MARVDLEGLRSAVLNAVEDAGGNVEFQTLADTLNAQGNGAAVPMLRRMKHEGLITMRLEQDDNGVIRHYVAVPVEAVG